jgi:hypothetical protein
VRRKTEAQESRPALGNSRRDGDRELHIGGQIIDDENPGGHAIGVSVLSCAQPALARQIFLRLCFIKISAHSFEKLHDGNGF